MGCSIRTDSTTSAHASLRLVGILLFLILVVRGGFLNSPELEAASPVLFLDSDHDGLSDAFEAYLSTASTDPALEANPANADSDADGQPDGFEYCLSGREGVYSPGLVHPIEPKVILGSRQEADRLVLTLYVIPGDISALDKFHFLVAVPGPAGAPLVLDLTDLLALNIQAVGVAAHGPYLMSVFQTSFPLGIFKSFPSMSIAALGEVAGVKTGDSATFTVHNGVAYRWVYTLLEGNPGDPVQYAQGEAQPQEAVPGSDSEPNKVCGSVDVRDPTGVKGVLESIVVAVNCNGGSWTCSASVCADGGPASQPKVVLDYLQLLK